MPGPANVLLIIADTVRADHLDLYGYHRATAPRLARRMVERPGWTIFDRCYSTAGWTLPACASIVTGQNPDRHGLTDHTRRFTTEKISAALRPTHRTVGIANNGNLVSDDISVEMLESLGMARRPRKWNHFGWNEGFDRYLWFPHDQHGRAINTAVRLLSRWRNETRPWFLMLHTNLAHDYNLDRPYYRATDRFLSRALDPRLHEFPDGPEVWSELADLPDLAEQVVAKYDSGLRRLDRALDRVLSCVDLDHTIVVVVSDHGEGFDPGRGRVHHCGRLHEDLLHVPLLFHVPPALFGDAPPPIRIARTRMITDIVPTILRLTGASMSGRLDGRDLFAPDRHRTVHAMDSAYLYREGERPIRRLSSDHGPVESRAVINFPLKTTTTIWENAQASRGQINLAYDPLEDGVGGPSSPGSPIPAVTVVVDFDEFRHNLGASTDVTTGELALSIVDNRENRAGNGIGALYRSASAEFSGPVVFIHPDVYLPDGWVGRLRAALAELDRLDADWAVAGVAGRTRGSIDRRETGIGHWADPHGYRRFGPLPRRVDVVDEMIIVTRDRSVGFDERHPGFHCYGTDVCAEAQHAGRTVWVIDDFAWHKMRRPDRSLCEVPAASRKIAGRAESGFTAEFELSATWVRDKWAGRHPLQGMTEFWRDFYGEG